MRVLAVGNMYPPHHSGGYELVWQAAVGYLRAQGHEVRVLTTDHRIETVEPEEQDVHRELRWYWRAHEIVDPGPVGSLRIERHNLRAFGRHLREFAPDVLTWWSMGAMSLSLIECGRRAGLPAVAFVHDDWLDYGRRADGWYKRFRRRPRRGRAVERLTGVPTRVDFAAAARYVFVSRTTKARALFGGIALYDTAIAPSGIDPSFIAPAPAREWRWRLLYVGRIDPRKGIETAIVALSELPPQASLDVVGGGDDRELARLRGIAAELGIAERVNFAGGCSRDALPAAYADADAVVFPVTWAEPWGLVPLEAMACGRPVVATGCGGSGEYLRDGENALLFPPGDASGLAAALMRLAGDPALRERLNASGLATAKQHTEAHFNRAVADAVVAARSGGAPAPAPRVRLGGPGPQITVVIPTLNRTDRLRRTLTTLERQRASAATFEVIVVADAGSEDREAVRDAVAAAARPYAATTIDCPDPGAACARNAGWRAARAPLVMFLGDDILASRDLIAEHLAWHEREPDERVGVLGHVRWARELDVTPFMRWLEHGLQFNYPTIDGIDAGFGHFYTANVSLKRSMLEHVDGFDAMRFPFLYEDIDLGYRLYDHGFRLLYNRRAEGEHLHPTAVADWSGRMRATARSERTWTMLHPELEPYFHGRLSYARELVPLRGRAVKLLRWVPPSTPWLGRRVWRNATVYYRQQLAGPFLEAWEADEARP